MLETVTQNGNGHAPAETYVDAAARIQDEDIRAALNFIRRSQNEIVGKLNDHTNDLRSILNPIGHAVKTLQAVHVGNGIDNIFNEAGKLIGIYDRDHCFVQSMDGAKMGASSLEHAKTYLATHCGILDPKAPLVRISALEGQMQDQIAKTQNANERARDAQEKVGQLSERIDAAASPYTDLSDRIVALSDRLFAAGKVINRQEGEVTEQGRLLAQLSERVDQWEEDDKEASLDDARAASDDDLTTITLGLLETLAATVAGLTARVIALETPATRIPVEGGE